ncbi:MAG: serine hydrolase [Saprospiraceae bacterium]|nr:serine hydrolase [Saprospiraceae bacterium]MDW8485277.1 serine hydrolase [Saprospiraceae bacterium]
MAQKSLSQADPRLVGMDSIVLRVLENWRAPGCAIAIVEKNRVLFTGGFGYRDYAAGLPATERTLFQIGSCTKAFTCALAGILADEGLLALDSPVQAYLPEFRLHDRALTPRVTLLDFMCHRSGLPRHDLSWLHHPTTRDSFVWRLAHLEASADLRARWQYNNFGYTLIGAVVERVGRKKWETLLRERIFEPIGMRTTRFDLWTLPPEADFARGYRTHADSIRLMDYFRIEGMGPAGSICASAADIARWLLLWVNGGVLDGQTILSPTFVRDALSAHAAMPNTLPNRENPTVFSFGYGLGWALASYRGHYRAAHGGNINGFSADVCLFPTDSLAIAVFVNQNRSQVPSILRNLIADRLLGLPYCDWDAEFRRQYVRDRLNAISAQQDALAGRKSGTTPAHPRSAYAGRYYNEGYGALHVIWRNDSLLAHTPGVDYHLKHFHYEVFRAVPTAEEAREGMVGLNLRFSFVTNLQGEVSELHAYGIEPAIEKVVFKREVAVHDVPADQLARYCGAYILFGKEVRVFLKGKALKVLVPDQLEYEAIPSGNHTFKLKGLEGYSIRFEMQEDASAPAALLFVQPNGTFRARRK